MRLISGASSSSVASGISPTVSTPCACRPSRLEAAMPTATATKGAGTFGRKRTTPMRMSSIAMLTTSVAIEVCGS
jgi:hypothetical protein